MTGIRPLLLALLVVAAIVGPSLPDSGFILDDAVNLASHAHHGDWLGEWTTPTYRHADPSHSGHVWRPLPATLQHLLAIVVGRESVVPFRLLTLAFHLANVAAAFALARACGARSWLAGVAAAVAGGHAVALESACWASCLFDVGMTTAVFGTIFAVRSAATSAGVFALALLGGAAAALFKESASALFPFVGALAAFFGRAGPRPARRGATTGLGFMLGTIVILCLHNGVTAEPYQAVIVWDRIGDYAAAWLQAFGWWQPRANVAPLSHVFRADDSVALLVGFASLAIAGGGGARALRKRNDFLPFFAIAAWALPLLPASIVVVTTGTASIRFAYAGWLLALPLVAASFEPVLDSWRGRYAGALFLAAVVASSVGTLSRPRALSTETSLWADELRHEPTPWALARLGRFRWVADHSEDALVMWKAGIETAPSGLLWVRPRSEWWDYAQAAFLSGEPAESLYGLDQLAAIALAPDDYPAMYPCLHADTLDALGRHDEAAAAATGCGAAGTGAEK